MSDADYAAIDKAMTAAPWVSIPDWWEMPDEVPSDFVTVAVIPADAAGIVALRNGIANGDLVPRSEVDALVAVCRAVKAIPRRRDDSPELNTARNNAVVVLRCAALAPFVEVGS